MPKIIMIEKRLTFTSAIIKENFKVILHIFGQRADKPVPILREIKLERKLRLAAVVDQAGKTRKGVNHIERVPYEHQQFVGPQDWVAEQLQWVMRF